MVYSLHLLPGKPSLGSEMLTAFLLLVPLVRSVPLSCYPQVLAPQGPGPGPTPWSFIFVTAAAEANGSGNLLVALAMLIYLLLSYEALPQSQ